jgi:hypothetical protein
VNELKALIAKGKLKPGTLLFHSARHTEYRNVTAKVVREGLEVRGRTFSSPTGAAQAITGQAVNGWLFWRVPPSGEPLARFRDSKG